MSWCCIFGTHASSPYATKQERNGCAIGKTIEKTTEHLRDVSTRKSQWQNDRRGEPQMHVPAADRESEELQLKKVT